MNSLSSICISTKCSISEALELLNSTKLLILLVVDEKGKLIRTVTDGDIRRLLLKKGTLNSFVYDLPHKEPISVVQGTSKKKVLSLMYEKSVNFIPVLNKTGIPIQIHLKSDLDKRIQLSIPHLTGEEQDYIEQAFDTNWIAPLGPNVDSFEKELSDYIGGAGVVALNTGTAAIHLALRLLDVSNGDFVLCQSFTFIASANPILYQGAIPVFVDSEPQTWNMSPNSLTIAIEQLRKENKTPKAVIITHLYGQSAKLNEIMEICNFYNIPVIEDAAESLGSFYQGKHTGTIGKLGVFSFNGNKIITASSGGALVSSDEKLLERARFLSTQAKDNAPYYLHSEVGYNYRMSNILAGVARAQLKVLNDRVTARRNIQKIYKDGLKDIKQIEWINENQGDRSNCWLSVFRINPTGCEFEASDLIDFLVSRSIEARRVWKPLHGQPLFKGSIIFSDNEEILADQIFQTGICLPSSSNMSISDQKLIIECIKFFFKK